MSFSAKTQLLNLVESCFLLPKYDGDGVHGNGISQVKLDRSQSFYIIHTLAGSAITSAGMGSATKASFLGSIRQ